MFKVTGTTISGVGVEHETSRYFHRLEGRMPLNPGIPMLVGAPPESAMYRGCSTRRTP